MSASSRHRAFIERGVVIHDPDTVALDLAPEQIAPGAELFPGTRLRGAGTRIGPDCRIGAEGPATLVNCQLGREVHFQGGFAEGAVLLDGVSVGSGAHVRPGTLLEEQSSCAHSVGLKQTILMPYVTLGSLINFCDCLMAGGTGPDDHGEVGSSFIHFNFTAHQDKATPSLMGDVPRGVMLDRPAIFLGGQGGLVGPVRIAYGTVLAAGSVCRRDVPREGLLVFGSRSGARGAIPYRLDQYGDLDRIIRNNMTYIGNLHALAAWYRYARPAWTPGDAYSQACLQGASRLLAGAIAERIKQLDKLASKVARSPGPFKSHRRLLAWRSRIPELAEPPADADIGPPAALRDALSRTAGTTYLEAIRELSPDARQAGTAWLDAIVHSTETSWEGTPS